MLRTVVFLGVCLGVLAYGKSDFFAFALQTPQGKKFEMKNLQGAPSVILYVDPDEKEEAERIVKELDRSGITGYRRVFIVNLLATWKPASLIRSVLSKRQKQSSGDTIYLLDQTAQVANKWGLSKEGISVLVIDRDAKVRLRLSSPLRKRDIEKIPALLKTL